MLATFGHDNLGRRTSLTHGNGTVTSYAYDVVSRLNQLGQDFAGTSSDLTLGVTHNPAAQIASATRSNDAFAYTGRVNANVTDTINGLNQLTASGGTSLSHDARGNISGIGSASFSYTSENRLATAPGYYLPYWPSGELAQLYRSADGAQTFFDHVGGQIVAERDGSHAITRRYVHAPGALAEPFDTRCHCARLG